MGVIFYCISFSAQGGIMNSTIELLRSHRSIRKFREVPVKEEILRAILEAGQCASTSHFVQAYSIIQIKDPCVRDAMADLAGSQKWIVSAPVFLVFCADLNRLEQACSIHGKTLAGGYAEQLLTATVDTALVAQNVMVAAESLGLGGVFIGGIRNDPVQVCELLDIPDNVFPVFGMCLGYPDDDPGKKPRLPLDLVLKSETYGRGEYFPEALQAYDTDVAAYYLSRSTNTKEQTWTRQMADFMSQIIRPHMKSFLERKGFFLR